MSALVVIQGCRETPFLSLHRMNMHIQHLRPMTDWRSGGCQTCNPTFHCHWPGLIGAAGASQGGRKGNTAPSLGKCLVRYLRCWSLHLLASSAGVPSDTGKLEEAAKTWVLQIHKPIGVSDGDAAVQYTCGISRQTTSIQRPGLGTVHHASSPACPGSESGDLFPPPVFDVRG